MHYDIHFRSDVVNKIKDVVNSIHTWNVNDTVSIDEIEVLSEFVQSFDHCAKPDRPFHIGGADGSGDFPCVAYGDSMVYLVTAMSRYYEASTAGVLKEQNVSDSDIVDFLWLPSDLVKSKAQFKSFFAQLMGDALETICDESDYYELTKAHGGGLPAPVDMLGNNHLILPPAHESNNISIQLLTTAEAAALVRIMKSLDTSNIETEPIYLLEDTTMALPMVTSKSVLFFEIAKRYACKIARDKGIAYMTVSKSHNMPHMDLIEDMIKEKVPSGEHWFLRVPFNDEWDGKAQFLKARAIPPVGAVSYIFKFHKTTQPMRLDMDYEFWKAHVWSEDKSVMSAREKQIFRDLDFASHDQRCYGYPYPIKACHDMVSMTNDERVAMRKQIIDEAVKAGLKRKNFVDPSILTGHA